MSHKASAKPERLIESVRIAAAMPNRPQNHPKISACPNKDGYLKHQFLHHNHRFINIPRGYKHTKDDEPALR
jgi:hypothetical protein